MFRCPYYHIAEGGIYGHLDDVSLWNTSYYEELRTFSGSSLVCDSDAFDALERWPTLISSPTVAAPASAPADTSEATACERLYQASSLISGVGPFYPVWTQTADYFNRFHPCITPDLTKRCRCFPQFDTDLQEFLTEKMGGSLVTSTFSAVKEDSDDQKAVRKIYSRECSGGWCR